MARVGCSSVTKPDHQSHDPVQIELMKEECILVDPLDRVTGHASKYQTHILTNIEKGTALHRAFSVFLFDSSGRLVLQKRASSKITFPDMWTNTCCSHPLYRPEELEEKDHIGVRRAAVRKLNHELGITSDWISPDDIVFLTRIIYQAPSNDEWGEHEVDYILFAQKDIPVDRLNENEVSQVSYVTKNELQSILDTRTINEHEEAKLTPWFAMVAQSGLLFRWWDQLPQIIQQKGLSNEDERNKIFPLSLDDASSVPEELLKT